MGNVSFDRMIRLIGDGLSLGVIRRSSTTFEWDSAGRCEAPVLRSFESRPLSVPDFDRLKLTGRVSVVGYDYAPGRNHVVHLDMWVPCRRCPVCLMRRSLTWRDRAVVECGSAVRSWFGTLTLSPDAHFLVESRLRHADDENGLLFERLTPEEQFLRRCSVIGKAVTLYWKRLRKTHNAALRYLSVFERHRTGLPHIHCLVHETDPARPVRKRALQSEWKLGFSQFRLVDDGPNAARYVTKYLTKELATRVRSSLLYGKQPLASLGNQATELTLTPRERGLTQPTLEGTGEPNGELSV